MAEHIVGYCPMGCGQTLVRGYDGHVVCSWKSCPDPQRLDKILSDPETEHVVWLGEDSFTVGHPLRERAEDMGELLDCPLHQELSDLAGPPVPPGKYRVTRREHDGTSESFRSDASPFVFEPID